MLKHMLNFLLSSLKSRQTLVLENIALRHQLDVLQRNAKRPRLKPNDRALWALLSPFLPNWRQHLTIVQPDTDLHTAMFKMLYVFLILSLDRRKIIYFNITKNPTADWTSLQLIQAFPFDTAPRFLIRDRDGIYGQHVVCTLKILGINIGFSR